MQTRPRPKCKTFPRNITALYKNRTNLGVFSLDSRTRTDSAARSRGWLGARGVVFRRALVATRGAQRALWLVSEDTQTPLSLLLQLYRKVWVSLHLALGACMHGAHGGGGDGEGHRGW